MFKFNFDLEDGDLDDSNNPLEPQATGPEAPSPQNLKPFAEIQFEDLVMPQYCPPGCTSLIWPSIS
ncbi:hypothetical protein EUX98_g3638 [Antrodiella citrinella]|uniref:Uncharacterized protein n=1 Tax=Antrodiella citrinella TaxID=2447956 RepID=A0A4S4MW02_9APHY|nr:hypothetical protein EUX98_g3638 [Antrodiella citrinella]